MCRGSNGGGEEAGVLSADIQYVYIRAEAAEFIKLLSYHTNALIVVALCAPVTISARRGSLRPQRVEHSVNDPLNWYRNLCHVLD